MREGLSKFVLYVYHVFVFEDHLLVRLIQLELSVDSEEKLVEPGRHHPMRGVQASPSLLHEVRVEVIEVEVEVDLGSCDPAPDVELALVPALADPAVVLALDLLELPPRHPDGLLHLLLRLHCLLAGTSHCELRADH